MLLLFAFDAARIVYNGLDSCVTFEIYERLMEELASAGPEVRKTYDDAILELKKFEVHSVLRKDGKQTLMDFYYDEAAMNRWRDSCKRTEESLKNRIDKFDKEISAAKIK